MTHTPLSPAPFSLASGALPSASIPTRCLSCSEQGSAFEVSIQPGRFGSVSGGATTASDTLQNPSGGSDSHYPRHPMNYLSQNGTPARRPMNRPRLPTHCWCLPMNCPSLPTNCSCLPMYIFRHNTVPVPQNGNLCPKPGQTPPSPPREDEPFAASRFIRRASPELRRLGFPWALGIGPWSL